MNFMLYIAGALASLFIFFYAAARTAENQANIFLIFVGLFLFLLFAWQSTIELNDYMTARKRKK